MHGHLEDLEAIEILASSFVFRVLELVLNGDDWEDSPARLLTDFDCPRGRHNGRVRAHQGGSEIKGNSRREHSVHIRRQTGEPVAALEGRVPLPVPAYSLKGPSLPLLQVAY